MNLLKQHKRFGLLLSVMLCISLTACVSSPAQSETKDDVVIGTLGTQQKEPGAIKRQELQSAIMRYADRYTAFMSMEAERIDQNATTPQQRSFAAGLKVETRTAAVDIAVGPNPVENLLDLIVLVTLTRVELETYWVPEVLGSDMGESLINTARNLEKDIWKRSAKVLTSAQQQTLKELIIQFNEEHPDQHFFWEMRFGEFSDQRAADLARVEQTGGLLGEVRQTRETVEEVQDFTERLMYYMLRAPTLTRLEAELGMRRALESPEVVQLLDNTERLTRSTERYATMLEHLPREREAAIVQMFEEFNKERDEAIRHLFEEMSAEREAAINQIVEKQSEAIKALLVSEELKGTVSSISDEGGEIANTTFIRGMILIVFWVIAYISGKLFYDYLVYRRALTRQSRTQKDTAQR
jgi:hypothetical protein